MFKMLVLQHLYNLAGGGIEYSVRDRLSFMRFLGLQLEDRVPDAKTVWLFWERLKDLKLAEDLFNRFHEQLTIHGYVARAGQMIDVTFAEAPRQRNNREENAQIKADITRWPSATARRIWPNMPTASARTGRASRCLPVPRHCLLLPRWASKWPRCWIAKRPCRA